MLTLPQVLAIAIFMGILVVLIIGKVHRYIPALIGAAVTFIVIFVIILKSPGTVLHVLNLGQLGQFSFWIPGQERIESYGINWQSIIFIAGMMTMVAGLRAVGFFRWLCLYLGRLVNYQVVPILIVFMLLSGFLSMLISSITVLLVLSSVTIELARLLKFDPVPIIIAEIFASNVGGSATMAGDPPNIIIGTALGYHFTDFIANTGLIAWAGMGVALGFFYFRFRKILAAQQSNSSNSLNQYPAPKEAIINPRLFKIQAAIFIMVIVLLVTHAQTGLSVALVGCIGAGATLLAAGRGALHIIKRVDWRTLLFFIGLFICVAGLQETGVLKIFAQYIGDASKGNILLAIPIILWLSTFASAVVDNIPFAAAMVPVITSLSQTVGLKLPSLAWTLALGTDIGGNATPVGASANVVGIAIAEREGYPISWRRFLKYAFPATIMVVALSHLMLIVRYA
jgi:Na+/H+ antiporter NhaD/arsenite permease-like protein